MVNVKIDIHTHACLKKTPREKNPWNPKADYCNDAAELKAHLQQQGIVHALLMSGGESNRGWIEGNDTASTIASQDPAFFSWMCNFDNRDPETIYERMALYKKQGAVGVGEVMINEWIDSPILQNIFTAAEKLHMPLTFHMSPEPGFAYGICDRAGLPLLEQALKKHPGLTVFGHSQVFWLEISADCPKEGNEARSAMGKGPVVRKGRVEELFETYPNLCGDLSAFSGSLAILRDPSYGLWFLEHYHERLCYATDTTNQYETFPLGEFLDQAAASGKLSRKAYTSICYENAVKYFGIHLEEK